MQYNLEAPEILVVDQTNELYKERTSLTWEGTFDLKKCSLSDVTNYPAIIWHMLDCLYYADHQYRDQHKQSSPHYSLCDIHTVNSFRGGAMVPTLNYRVFGVSDIGKKSFFLMTDPTDQGFRPLFKDYELFIIELLVLQKQYYWYPFLLAVQRTCYLWLLNLLPKFELRGATTMKVIWAETNPKRDFYYLYTATISLDFDLSQCYGNGDGTMTSVLDLKLGIPHNLTRSKIPKSQFDDDRDFHNHLWSLRIKTITETIKNRKTSLYCTEQISDIE